MKPSLLLSLGVALVAGTTGASAQTVISRQVTSEPVETVVTQDAYGDTYVTRRPLGAGQPAPIASETVITEQAPTVTTRERIIRRPPRAVPHVAVRRPARRIIERSTNRRIIASPPIRLQPTERQMIYRTIVREQTLPPSVMVDVPPAPGLTSVSYVGMRLPTSVQLYTLPEDVAYDVPAIRSYRYAMVDDRVLLVNPETGLVIEDISP